MARAGPGRRSAGPGSAGRAFSSEVAPGSREENTSKQESRAPFRFYRNGKGSCRASLRHPAHATHNPLIPE
ncbi:hypothetical protein XI02_05270 [Bradyrhizobium sp. CCBAU 21365]|nr:hypothetical protein XI02_05270 [Bradyrhizobium sp. CCBAU 21365]